MSPVGRWRIAVGVVMAALAVLGATGISQIRFDPNVRNLFRGDDRAIDTLHRIYDAFGADDRDCNVVVRRADLLSPSGAGDLRDLVRTLHAIPEVESVLGLDAAVVMDPLPRRLLPDADAPPQRFEGVRDALREHPVGHRLLNADGDAALLLVRLREDLDEIAWLAPDDCPLRLALRDSPFETILTGVPVIRAELLTSLRREQARYLAIGLVAGAIVALVVFRQVRATIIVSLSAVLGACWTIGALGLVGIPINPINGVLPTLVLIVGFADAMHLVHGVRLGVRDGMTPGEAGLDAVRKIGPACLLTSITTAVGFASLVVARVDVIREFGVTAALGAIMALVAVLSTTFVLTAILGVGPASPPSAWSRRWIGSMLAKRRTIALVGLVVTAILAWTASSLVPSSSLKEGLPRRSESASGVAVVDREFGGVLSLLVLVEWEDDALEALDVMRDVDRVFQSDPATGDAISVVDLIDLLPGSNDALRLYALNAVPDTILDRFYRADRKLALMSAPMPDVGTRAQAPTIASIEEALASLEREGVSLTLSGSPVAFGRNAERIIRDLAASIGLASGVIFIALALAFRSVRIGLVSVIPNAFPLLVVGAMLVWKGLPLTTTGVISMCVCLGIAVDDTIHLIARYRRERRVASPEVAMERAIAHVGSALVGTTAVLGAGMFGLLFSDLAVMRLFGEICIVAMVAALVGDLVMLPAMVLVTRRADAPPRSAPSEVDPRVPSRDR